MASSPVPLMDDFEIQARVESLAGPHAKILDCEKKSSLVTEEILLLNGQPVKLTGEAGERIKACLKAGQPPPPEILSEILIRNGIQIGNGKYSHSFIFSLIFAKLQLQSNSKQSQRSNQIQKRVKCPP